MHNKQEFLIHQCATAEQRWINRNSTVRPPTVEKVATYLRIQTLVFKLNARETRLLYSGYRQVIP